MQEEKRKRGRPSIYAHLSAEERLARKMEMQRQAARAYYHRHKGEMKGGKREN